MDIYVKRLLFLYFLFFFWISNIILSDALIVPVSQLQTQHVMTSQIRSHIKYVTDLLYSVAHFIVEIDENFSLNGGF